MNFMNNYKVSINGVITPNDQAKISIFDRGFLFGDSIYEVCCSYDGILFTWTEHLERLFNSASILNIEISQSKETLTKWATELFKESEIKRCYLRIILTRGEGPPDIKVPKDYKTNVIMLIKPLAPYPEEWYRIGNDVITSSFSRNSKEALDPNAKSGNYLNNILAVNEAQKKNVYDALMFNKEGFLTEATTSNIWFIKDGKLCTPSTKTGILHGITRRLIFKICAEKNIQINEGFFTKEDLAKASEIFLTSSTKEIIPIKTLDGENVGDGTPGKETKKIHQFYKEYIQQKVEHAKSLKILYT